MIELAVYLNRKGYRPRQVQDFIPAPMDVATCMYYAGIDPAGMRPVDAARGGNERKIQRALMQFCLPENYFTVRLALTDAGRTDLIGPGPECLIPTHPTKEAVRARKEKRDRPRNRTT